MSDTHIAVIAPEERAANLLAFDKTKADLTVLASQSEHIIEITNKAGRDQCHAAMMVLKGSRVEIERRGKDARDDANKFAKAVIAKEKELIGVIAPEEERLQLLRDSWDAEIQQALLRRQAAEQERINGIRSQIQSFRDEPSKLTGKPSAIINGALVRLHGTTIGDTFEEFTQEGQDALTAAISHITTMLAQQQAQETEQAQIKADREKLAQLEREAEERRAADAERDRANRAAEEHRLRTLRTKIESIRRPLASKAEWNRVDAEALLELIENDALNVADFGDLADEATDAYIYAREQVEDLINTLSQIESQRIARAEQQAVLDAQREAQEAAQRELDEREAQLKRDQQVAAAKAEQERLDNLGVIEAAQAVVDHFGDLSDAPKVVLDLAVALVNHRQPAKPAAAKKGKK